MSNIRTFKSRVNMQENENAICPICQGDKNVGEIAKRMGYRPDMAFLALKNNETRLKIYENALKKIASHEANDLKALSMVNIAYDALFEVYE